MSVWCPYSARIQCWTLKSSSLSKYSAAEVTQSILHRCSLTSTSTAPSLAGGPECVLLWLMQIYRHHIHDHHCESKNEFLADPARIMHFLETCCCQFYLPAWGKHIALTLHQPQERAPLPVKIPNLDPASPPLCFYLPTISNSSAGTSPSSCNSTGRSGRAALEKHCRDSIPSTLMCASTGVMMK